VKVDRWSRPSRAGGAACRSRGARSQSHSRAPSRAGRRRRCRRFGLGSSPMYAPRCPRGRPPRAAGRRGPAPQLGPPGEGWGLLEMRRGDAAPGARRQDIWSALFGIAPRGVAPGSPWEPARPRLRR
jgi:hypothetical protein